jgi:hypothetical protein
VWDLGGYLQHLPVNAQVVHVRRGGGIASRQFQRFEERDRSHASSDVHE